MNARLIVNLLGKILLLEGVLMAPSLAVSLIYGDGSTLSLLWSIAIVCALGFPLTLLVKPKADSMRSRDGFVTVALAWIVLSAFGALPFCIGGHIQSYVDAFFEAASGFTTTGSTILSDVEAMPKGLLFWRSFTNWVGGMGVLVLTLAILPRMGARAVHLLRAESPGPNPGKLVPKLGDSAKITYMIYFGMSLVLFFLLMLEGMDAFDASIHTFSTAGTGGFSSYNASIGHFKSAAIENTIAIAMLLFGVNFIVHFQLITRNFRGILKNSELKLYGAVVAIAVLLVAWNIFPSVRNLADSLRLSLFQVSSIITSTGFSTTDFNLWPVFSKALLLLFMITGPCAGSTGGGVKLVRIGVLFKSMIREIQYTIHPRSVRVVKDEGRAVDERSLSAISIFFFSYIFVVVIATLLVSLDNYSLETTLSSVLSAMGNTGPGLDAVGPVDNWGMFSPFSKIVLSLCMLIGRLEIFPILMLAIPRTWKNS